MKNIYFFILVMLGTTAAWSAGDGTKVRIGEANVELAKKKTFISNPYSTAAQAFGILDKVEQEQFRTSGIMLDVFPVEKRKEFVRSYLGQATYDSLLRQVYEVVNTESDDPQYEIVKSQAVKFAAFNLFDRELVSELWKKYFEFSPHMQEALILSSGMVGESRGAYLLKLYAAASEKERLASESKLGEALCSMRYMPGRPANKFSTATTIDDLYILEEAIKELYGHGRESSYVLEVLSRYANDADIKLDGPVAWAILVCESRMAYIWDHARSKTHSSEDYDIDKVAQYLNKIVVQHGSVNALSLLIKLNKTNGIRKDIEASDLVEIKKNGLLLYLDKVENEKEKGEKGSSNF
jgi:hypothetical protein